MPWLVGKSTSQGRILASPVRCTDASVCPLCASMQRSKVSDTPSSFGWNVTCTWRFYPLTEETWYTPWLSRLNSDSRRLDRHWKTCHPTAICSQTPRFLHWLSWKTQYCIRRRMWFWRWCLQLNCHTLHDHIDQWPKRNQQYIGNTEEEADMKQFWDRNVCFTVFIDLSKHETKGLSIDRCWFWQCDR